MKKIDVGNRLHEAMQVWNNGMLMAQNGYLYMGKSLCLMKEDNIYRAMGSHIISWKHFVENELHISKAQADRLIQIYRDIGALLEKHSMVIDISKVTLLLPLLNGKTEDEKVDLLNMAKDCKVEDIKNNIKDLTGKGTTTDNCNHMNTELVSRCKDCGKWLK